MEALRESPPSPLRLEVRRQGIKPWRMAQQLGVSLTLYYSWELGRRRIPANIKHRIGELLGITDVNKLEELMPEDN